MQIADLDERTRRAIEELQGAITAHYPTSIFALERSPDDPASIHLVAVADVDDPDEVGDLVVERVVDFQIAGFRVHVIPIRTPARIQVARVRHQLAAARTERTMNDAPGMATTDQHERLLPALAPALDAAETASQCAAAVASTPGNGCNLAPHEAGVHDGGKRRDEQRELLGHRRRGY